METQLETLHNKYTREMNIEKSKKRQTLETRIRQACYRKILDDIESIWSNQNI